MPRGTNHRACFVGWMLMLLTALPLRAQGPQFDLSRAQWRVRDVVTKSGWVAAGEKGDVEGLKLRLEHGNDEKDFEVWTRSCAVVDTTGGERAVTLAMCIP